MARGSFARLQIPVCKSKQQHKGTKRNKRNGQPERTVRAAKSAENAKTEVRTLFELPAVAEHVLTDQRCGLKLHDLDQSQKFDDFGFDNIIKDLQLNLDFSPIRTGLVLPGDRQ